MRPRTLQSIACVIQAALLLVLAIGCADSVFSLKSERRMTIDNNGHTVNQLMAYAQPDLAALRREANPPIEAGDDQRALTNWFYRFAIERAEHRHRLNAWMFFIGAVGTGVAMGLSRIARRSCPSA